MCHNVHVQRGAASDTQRRHLQSEQVPEKSAGGLFAALGPQVAFELLPPLALLCAGVALSITVTFRTSFAFVVRNLLCKPLVCFLRTAHCIISTVHGQKVTSD